MRSINSVGISTAIVVAVFSSALSPAAMAVSNTKKAEKAVEFLISKDMDKKLNAMQWTMKASKPGRPILSGNHYQLFNMAIERGLKRQKRTLGANLGFLATSSSTFNMLIKRKNRDGQVRYGDVVALNLKPYGWLRHKKQGRWGGINLGDDDHKPHFIWQIRGGKVGTKLLSGMPFALKNVKPYEREVIFCRRSSGIDLGWRGTSKCGGRLAKASGRIFGANGSLSGDGLSGRLATKWKKRLCQAGVGAAGAYVAAQTGGVGTAAVAAAAPVAIKKCESI